jgi:hypothetical protein
MSPDEQIAHALKPTREQLAYIQAAATFDEHQTRATEFLTERKAQNKALFDRSRHWGPEIDRQADAAAGPQEVRLTGPRHTQAWRADVADLRDFAHRPSTSERAPSLDPRFAHAPMTRGEMEALQQAATPKGVSRLLGEMHEARLKDGRLPQTSGAHPEKAPDQSGPDPSRANELGLRPTAAELAYMQDGAIQGQEHDRARGSSLNAGAEPPLVRTLAAMEPTAAVHPATHRKTRARCRRTPTGNAQVHTGISGT